MNADSRLNILLTHSRATALPGGEARKTHSHHPPMEWYRSLSALLAPLGVRTFEATTGHEAMAVIEQNPIHLAVVDTRLNDNDELSLPKLIQKLKEPCPPPDIQKRAFRVHVQIDHADQNQRIEVRLDAQTPLECPTVILLTPARNDRMLAEALKFNVFSVVSEPVDVNLMLELMARAMKRFHQNQWPV
jgi:DNA-binding NtrC family response regulator